MARISSFNTLYGLGFGFLLLASCTAHEVRLAQELAEQQNWDGAVSAYRDAIREDPFNDKLIAEYEKVRAKASELHYQKGREYLKEGQIPEAMQEFQLALGLAPGKLQHQSALADVVRLKNAKEALKDGEKLRNLGRLDDAMNAFERAIELNPNLTEALAGLTAVAQEQKQFKAIGGSTEPVTLRFQNTRLKQVFEILARTANLNILFEKDVRDDLVTIFTKEMPFNEALTLILATNQLFYQQVGPDTLLIIPDTKQKRQQYQDLVIRTFYLSNAKAKDMANLVRTILETKRVYVNEPLNTIVIRDEPVKIQLAEQIILANDRRDSEVVLELEVFEVNRTKNRKLGASFGKQIGAGVFPPGSTFSSGVTDWTFRQLTSLGPDSYLLKFPSNVLLDFFKSESDAKTLASPQLRVLNNEKASINVGTKEPILLSTTNVLPGQATTGATPTTSTVTSIEFKDTGVKLDVEPTIHLTGEITINIKIEVSRIGDQVQLAEGINQFRFGNRTAETTLNMRDGETVILAGLLQEDDRKSRETVPGLEDIPFLEDLFLNDTTKVTTEVILSITPKLIRTVTPPSIAKQTLWSGTANHFAKSPQFAPEERLPVLEIPATEDRAAVKNATQPTPPQTMAVPSSLSAPPQPGRPNNQPQSKTKILVTPTQIQTSPGGTVRMMVSAEKFSSVQHTQMTISYDSALLDFIQATEGALFPNTSGQAGMTVSAVPQSGTIMLKLSTTGQGVNGNGLLTTLHFKAKAKGNAPIVIKQPSVAQGSGQPIPVLVQHGLIRIL